MQRRDGPDSHGKAEADRGTAERLLLVNDTSHTSNPGCQMVRKGLDALLNRARPTSEIVASIPLGYGQDAFRDIAATSKQCLIRRPDAFPVGAEHAPPVPLQQWERRADALIDGDFRDQVERCDAVVVNGEGTIHHNFPRALALCALMRAAVSLDRPVILLNSTLQAMDPRILEAVLPRLAMVQVREPRSAAELESLCIRPVCAPDLAFLAVEPFGPSDRRTLAPQEDACLVTAGVTATAGTLDVVFEAVSRQGLRPVYLSIGDGGEDAMASKVCGERGVSMVRACDIPIEEVLDLLGRFPVAVSGRHHMNICLLRAGVPFVPLPSNTWKIEATLSMVGYPVAPVRLHEELPARLGEVLRDRTALAAVCRRCFQKGLDDLAAFLRRMNACDC